jgi:hypothetical protein
VSFWLGISLFFSLFRYANNNERVLIKGIDFVRAPYQNEAQFHGAKVVGHWDKVRFEESLRVLTVQVGPLYL